MSEEVSKKKKGALSKEISFGKKGKYPTKTSMNFIVNEQAKTDRTALVLFPLFLIVLAVFVKFAVIDPMMKINKAENEYNRLQTTLTAYQENNASYEEVTEAYNNVAGAFMSEEEKFDQNRMQIIGMLEDSMMYTLPVQSVQITGATVTVQTGNTTLPVVSEMLTRLQNDSRNQYVTVTTTNAASAEGTEQVTANFVITYAGSAGDWNA